MSLWKCDVCTFDNSENDSKCAICTTKRPINIKKNEWKCQTCTFINSHIGNTCEICGMSKQKVTNRFIFIIYFLCYFFDTNFMPYLLLSFII